MKFEEWLFQAVYYLSIKYRKDETEVYSSIDLYDAKLQFLDNVHPVNFKE